MSYLYTGFSWTLYWIKESTSLKVWGRRTLDRVRLQSHPKSTIHHQHCLLIACQSLKRVLHPETLHSFSPHGNNHQLIHRVGPGWLGEDWGSGKEEDENATWPGSWLSPLQLSFLSLFPLLRLTQPSWPLSVMQRAVTHLALAVL